MKPPRPVASGRNAIPWSTRRPVLVLASLVLPFAAGCATVQEHGGAAAGVVGGVVTASEMKLLKTPYIAGALVAWSIYDPLAPNWSIDVHRMDDAHVRIDLRMRALTTGGEGEARRIFARNARQLAEEGGFAGFEVIRYEEGIESTRPFARRVASGELRFARSRAMPDL